MTLMITFLIHRNLRFRLSTKFEIVCYILYIEPKYVIEALGNEYWVLAMQ